MKKTISGLLSGLVLGGAVVWLAMHRAPEQVKPAEATASGPDLVAGTGAIAQQIAATGIAVAAPEAATLAPEVTAFGRVLDPAPFVALVADVATAQAALAASEKEFARAKALHDQGENASAQAVETAEAAAQRDRVQLAAARAKLMAGMGPALAAQADLAAILAGLERGQALARVDLLPGDALPAAPATAKLGLLTGGTESFEASVLGAAPAADPQAQGTGYLVLLRDRPLPTGAALRATFAAPGEAQAVLVVPRSALVRHAGGVFVYVRTAAGGYERHLVEVARPVANGVALASGIEASDQVVVTGAQQLLATELLASAGGEEEG